MTIHIEYMNKALIGVFTLELVLKVAAHRLDFFKDGWNLLDLIVVFFGILGYVI
jgi:voltage-gated sodium channel